ncbi:nickel insertion protein [Clostridium sp. DJ247]|uniref:nickel insertion protein n=1 Tax=Clostridium sp. DJ247 TaxID=2726188 RepID=UPI0028BE8BCB|nr:nickel insertion protein [Clostridium sp. DJ247]
MVGAAVAIDYLKVDKIMASPVQVGGGFVKCAHGLIPVPAPATVKFKETTSIGIRKFKVKKLIFEVRRKNTVKFNAE